MKVYVQASTQANTNPTRANEAIDKDTSYGVELKQGTDWHVADVAVIAYLHYDDGVANVGARSCQRHFHVSIRGCCARRVVRVGVRSWNGVRDKARSKDSHT